MSVTDFLAGGEPKPWWHFTELRKKKYGSLPTVAMGEP